MAYNDDEHNQGAGQDTKQQVLALLNQLGERLRRAEAEREGLREQLYEYREQIEEIDDRAATTEKVYLNIENRLNAYDRSEAELREELQDKVKKLEQVEARIPDVNQLEKKLIDRIPDTAELEKKLLSELPDTAALENKIVNQIPDVSALEKKLSEKIPDTAKLEERVESAEKQAKQAGEKAEAHANAAGKLERRIEQLINDNNRMSRKLERLEEDVAKTDDALKSRAMVLLTDRQTAEQGGQGYLPAGGAYAHNISNDLSGGAGRFMRLMQHPVLRVAGMVVLVLAGAGAGWLINDAARLGSGSQQTAQVAKQDSDDARRTTMAQMKTIPHTTQQRAGAEGADASSDKPPKGELSKQGGKNEAAEQEQTQTQTQTASQEGADAGEAQQTAGREDPDGPAVRMNASTPAAGKSDRSTTQAQMPDKELPAQLEGIYKQARGAEEAAEDTLMADKPETSINKRFKPDADLPGRFAELEEQALNGDARAQHDLAALYTAGRNGVAQDYDRAISLFRASARQDIANARYNLGVLYHQGLGVERDMQKAIRYYRGASLLDHAQARYNLGIAHIQGVGTSYNPRYAAAYFEKAARGGVVEAAYNLGLIYENGLAGKANTDLALFWYHHAAKNGSEEAGKSMDQIAKRLELSQADIETIIEDTDLDVKIPARQGADQKTGGGEPDKKGRKVMNMPGEVKPAFSPSKDPDLVTQIQRQLSRFDLYSGKTDGDMGPKTRKAIKAYQEMHDLPQTGESSEDLLVHMLSRSIQESDKTQAAN